MEKMDFWLMRWSESGLFVNWLLVYTQPMFWVGNWLMKRKWILLIVGICENWFHLNLFHMVPRTLTWKWKRWIFDWWDEAKVDFCQLTILFRVEKRKWISLITQPMIWVGDIFMKRKWILLIVGICESWFHLNLFHRVPRTLKWMWKRWIFDWWFEAKVDYCLLIICWDRKAKV